MRLLACFLFLFSIALAQGPDGAPEHIKSGNKALAQGEWITAEHAFRDVLASDPGSAGACRGLAIALIRQNRLADASTVLETGLRTAPTLPGGYFLLGLARFGTGDLKGAIIALRESADRNPNDRQTMLYLARAYFLLGERAQCAGVLEPLLADSRNDVEGLLLLSQAEPERAEAAGKRILQLAPDSYEAWQWQADSFEKQERLEEAVRAYRNAIGKAPAQAGVNFGLSRVYVKLADYEAARQCLRRELVLNPFSGQASLLLGTLELLDGGFDDAIAHLKQAASTPATAADAWLNLGRAYFRRGNAAEACEALRLAVDLRPDSAIAHYQLSLAWRRLGKTAEAEASMAEFQRLRAGSGGQ